MTRYEFENLLTDLDWLKKNHPERQSIIKFVEQFRLSVAEQDQERFRERQNDLNEQENEAPKQAAVVA